MTEKNKTSGIKSWPEDDRTREKLLKKGAGTLSSSELLAILLRTGTKGISAIDLSRKILAKFGSFRSMAHIDTRDWKEFKGLGAAKMAHIQAALEIGRRYQQEPSATGKQKFAVSIICVHNHPSGEITPSEQDKIFTRQLNVEFPGVLYRGGAGVWSVHSSTWIEGNLLRICKTGSRLGRFACKGCSIPSEWEIVIRHWSPLVLMRPDKIMG